MLHSASPFILWRKTDRIRCMPCVYLLVWFYAETRKKNLDHFCIEVFFWVISYDQAAVERLEHTLAKLWHTGPLIGQKCPKIEVNWQVDPRFAPKRNLSGKKNVLSEHSSGVAYHPYASNNCIFTIGQDCCGLGLGTWDLVDWDLIIGTWDSGLGGLELGGLRLGTRDLVEKDLGLGGLGLRGLGLGGFGFGTCRIWTWDLEDLGLGGLRPGTWHLGLGGLGLGTCDLVDWDLRLGTLDLMH